MKISELPIAKSFVAVPAAKTVAAALSDAGGARWIVLTSGDNLPVGLIETVRLSAHTGDTTLEQLAAGLPPLIVVPADMELAEAVRSPAFDELLPGAAGAVVVRDNTIEGVWIDTDLASALSQYSGTIRQMSAGDADLPGTITIPKVARLCRYVEGKQQCGVAMTFPEKPDQLPACPNPRELKPHTFVW